MTAQLSRERLEEIASWEIENTDAGTRHAPGAHSRVYSYEIVEMARMLMAAMDSEPVAWTDEQELKDLEKSGCAYLFTVNPITPNADPRRVIRLYTAPPAPVAVPDEKWVNPDIGYADENGFAEGWNACRAAMLNAGPVTEATWIDEAKKLAEMHGTSFVVFRNGESPQCAAPR